MAESQGEHHRLLIMKTIQNWMQGNFFQKSVSALADKRKDYLSAFEKLDDTGDFILRLLFADSASVIQDCIEIINEVSNEYGI